MINETVFSGQATDGISPDVTNFFERKTMSTKTTFKRVALVAVVALGLGGLSTVAAHAASTSYSVSAIARAGVGVQLTVTSDDSTATDNIHYAVLSAPTGAVIAQANAGTALVAGTKKIDIVDDAGTTNTITAGSYKLLVWGHASTSAVPIASDIATLVTFTAAGVPTQINLTSPTAVAAATGFTSSTGNAIANAAFSVSFQDANGVPTLLGTNETTAITVTPSTGDAFIKKVLM
jgi:hypothetical protein